MFSTNELMKIFQKKLVISLSALFVFAPAYAETSDAIITDRPDFVDSSDVVGRGRVQVEVGVSQLRTNDAATRTTTLSTPTLVRLGLNDFWEVRLQTDGFIQQRNADGTTGLHTSTRGFSDTLLGLKWHLQDGVGFRPSLGLLGDLVTDSGSTAFKGYGLRPSVRLVAEWDLPRNYTVGVMPGIAYQFNAVGRWYTNTFFGVSVGKNWTEQFRTFVEVAAPQIASARNGGVGLSLDIGAAYLITDTLQVDTSIFRGINTNTPSTTVGVGVSSKF